MYLVIVIDELSPKPQEMEGNFMKAKDTLIKHKGTASLNPTTQMPFLEFAVPFFIAILIGEFTRQAYSLFNGLEMYRQLWEQQFGWVALVTNNGVYYEALWMWVWILKAVDAVSIYRERVNWQLYRPSFVKDMGVTLIFFIVYFTKEYVNYLTTFRLSGHFLICCLTTAAITNESFNCKRYNGPKWLPSVVIGMRCYHYFSLCFTSFIYHSLIECISGVICGLAITHRIYYQR